MAKKKPPFCEHSRLPVDQCAHCSAVSPPQVKPTYELKYGTYRGSPVVEILKDGGPVHPYDEHFRFGSTKACLMLDAIAAIEQFEATTDEDGNTSIPSQTLDVGDNNTSFKTWIVRHQEFIRSDGVKIIRPWLHIRRLPAGAEIRIGVQKAKAICALQTDLKKWVFDVALGVN